VSVLTFTNLANAPPETFVLAGEKPAAVHLLREGAKEPGQQGGGNFLDETVTMVVRRAARRLLGPGGAGGRWDEPALARPGRRAAWFCFRPLRRIDKPARAAGPRMA